MPPRSRHPLTGLFGCEVFQIDSGEADSPPGRVRLPVRVPTALPVQILVILGSLASVHR